MHKVRQVVSVLPGKEETNLAGRSSCWATWYLPKLYVSYDFMTGISKESLVILRVQCVLVCSDIVRFLCNGLCNTTGLKIFSLRFIQFNG